VFGGLGGCRLLAHDLLHAPYTHQVAEAAACGPPWICALPATSLLVCVYIYSGIARDVGAMPDRRRRARRRGGSALAAGSTTHAPRPARRSSAHRRRRGRGADRKAEKTVRTGTRGPLLGVRGGGATHEAPDDAGRSSAHAQRNETDNSDGE
jgi:hypothetical protein